MIAMRNLALFRWILVGMTGMGCGAMAEDGHGPRTPEQERGTFAVDSGLTVDWVAAEPLVRSPSAIAWDEHGVLHVAENPGYPVGPAPGKAPEGALVRLTDRDGDGRADERVVLAEGLTFPNGLMPWRGGWLVTDAPNLLWLADTNSDGRADVQEVWFTGFATNQTTQLRACYPTLGPDGWIYVARGLSSGIVTSPKWTNLPAVDLKGGDFRFRPDGTRAEAIGGNTQFGMVLDDVGRRFLVSNRNPLMQAMVMPKWWSRHPALPFSDLIQDVSPTGYEAKVFPRSTDSTTAGYMPEFMAAPHAGTFTAACGIHQHFGFGLPTDYQGDWFVCEPAQNLVQRQRAEATGPTFRSRRIPEDRDFLTSTDGWFRPVFAATGPDGALYLADLYRKVIDHPDYLPAEVRGRLDFGAGKELGRIWRVRAGEGDRPVTNLGAARVSVLVQALSATHGWVRSTAHRLLLERGSTDVLPVLMESLEREWALGEAKGVGTNSFRRAVDPATGPHWGRARALALLASWIEPAGVDRRHRPEVLNRYSQCWLRSTFDESASVREVAWRIAQAREPDPKHALPDVGYEVVEWWSEDPSPAVRFHFALQCGNQDDWSPVMPALVRIARRDAGDRWTRAAVLSGLRGREAEFLRRLLEAPIPDTPEMAALFADLGWLCAGAGSAGTDQLLLGRAMDPKDSGTEWAMSAVARFAESLRARGRGGLEALLRQWDAADAGGRPWVQGWERFSEGVMSTAGDSGIGGERRTAAIRFLGELGFARARLVLDKALGRGEPEAVQLAAVRTLGRFDALEAGRMLVDSPDREAWAQSVRSLAIAAAGERAALVPALLDALERGALPLWVVEPQRRRTLQAHGDASIRERSRKLFATAGGEDRRRVFEELKSVLALPADGVRGREMFLKACASCHRYGADGVTVGPDLSGVRHQPAEALLLHIVVPDAEIYPGYQACEVETAEGRSLTGLLVSESADAVVLRKAGGDLETLPRTVVRSLVLSRVSLMPQELEKTMSPQELGDLIGFLKGR